jgi:hypothetical protein
MKGRMNKEWLPHTIAVGAFVVFIVLGLASASTPSVPRDQQQKIKELTKSRNPSESNMGLFGEPPSEGETVLGTFQGSLVKASMPSISAEEAQAYVSNRVLPKYTRPSFPPHEAAAALMIQASARFPEIEIENLCVRSIEQVGDIHVKTNLNPHPIPNLFGGPARYSFLVDETFTFKGVVVKTREVEIDQSVSEITVSGVNE